MLNDFRKELKNKSFLGVVEDSDDPKRKGRVKIRVERIHGRTDDKVNIPTADLPWASPDLDNRGLAFSVPVIGKVVNLQFTDGDWYKPVYTSTEHYNYNLQEKLQSLDKESYAAFYAITYDDKHQYFHDKDKGVIFDYVKSNFNIDPNGNMYMNLRDNKSKFFLGTEDASEPAVLGNHWMNWFDELIQNLMGAKGGPYLGNLGAPVIPNPGLLECLNKYLSIRPTFLSEHVFIVDNKQVKPQKRKFDKDQNNDIFNTEKLENLKTPENRGYTPEDRPTSSIAPATVTPNVMSNTFDTSNLPPNPTDIEQYKLIKPFDGYENGKLDVNKLTVSKWMKKSFGGTETPEYASDGTIRLLDEAAIALDRWLDSYSQLKGNLPSITIVRGYTNFEKQQNNRKRFGPSVPLAGTDPYGYANQIEIYFGASTEDTDDLIEFLSKGTINDNLKVKGLQSLIETSALTGWKLAGRNNVGVPQWRHWIYKPL